MAVGDSADFSGKEAHPMQMISMERMRARFFISKVSPSDDSNLCQMYQRIQITIYCDMYNKASIRRCLSPTVSFLVPLWYYEHHGRMSIPSCLKKAYPC